MHRGFMQMFPIDGVGSTPSSSSQNTTGQKIDPNKPKDPQNTKEIVSVFADGYDKNHDTKISKDEALNGKNSKSIFQGLYDTNTHIAQQQQTDLKNLQEQFKNAKNANIKFNATEYAAEAFDKAFKNASGALSNVTSKVEIVKDAEKNENRTEKKDAAIKALNEHVETTLKGVSANATNMLMNAYQDALNKATKDAQKEEDDYKAAHPDEVKPDGVNGGKDDSTITPEDKTDPDSLDIGGEHEGKGKTIVHAKYDINTNKYAEFSEMKEKFNYNDRITILTNNEAAKKAAAELKNSGEKRFLDSLSDFNANIGSKTVKIKAMATQADIEVYRKEAAEAKDTLNRKAEAAASKAQQKANDKVYQSLQREVNQTVANIMNNVQNNPEPEKPTDVPPGNQAKGAPPKTGGGTNGAPPPRGGGNNNAGSNSGGSNNNFWNNLSLGSGSGSGGGYLNNLLGGIGNTGGAGGTGGSSNTGGINTSRNYTTFRSDGTRTLLEIAKENDISTTALRNANKGASWLQGHSDITNNRWVVKKDANIRIPTASA